MDTNPYESPQTGQRDHSSKRRGLWYRLGWLAFMTIVGGASGLMLFSSRLRHPGDPSGQLTGFVIGGIVGVLSAVGLSLLLKLIRA